MEIKERVEGFKSAVKAKYKIDLYMTYGRRYVKVEKGSYVYCFIDMKNGDVLKPATWRGPAKHARSNVYNADFGLSGVNDYGANYITR